MSEQQRERDWTWKRIHHYHACTECGYVNESRKDFKVQAGFKVKDINCERCGKNFRVSKAKINSLGPLIEQE